MTFPKVRDYQTVDSKGKFIAGNPGGGRPKVGPLVAARDLLAAKFGPEKLVNATAAMFDIIDDAEVPARDRIKAYEVMVDLFVKESSPLATFRRTSKSPAGQEVDFYEVLANEDTRKEEDAVTVEEDTADQS